MRSHDAFLRGARDFKKHGQGVNCPFKPGWQRGYWLRGYHAEFKKAELASRPKGYGATQFGEEGRTGRC